MGVGVRLGEPSSLDQSLSELGQPDVAAVPPLIHDGEDGLVEWRALGRVVERGSLVEGNSIRATVRMTGAAKNTVTKLLVDLGAACAALLDSKLTHHRRAASRLSRSIPRVQPRLMSFPPD